MVKFNKGLKMTSRSTSIHVILLVVELMLLSAFVPCEMYIFEGYMFLNSFAFRTSRILFANFLLHKVLFRWTASNVWLKKTRLFRWTNIEILTSCRQTGDYGCWQTA